MPLDYPAIFPDGKPCPDLLTEQEAVRYLRLDILDIKHPELTIRRYRAGGRLRGVQISKAVLYPIVELRRFISSQLEDKPI